jgi:hypothetical protein
MNQSEKLESQQGSERALVPMPLPWISLPVNCGTMSLGEKKRQFSIPRLSPYVLYAITVHYDALGVFRLPRP